MSDTENAGSDSQGADSSVGDTTSQDNSFGDFPELPSQDSGTAEAGNAAETDNTGGHPAWSEYLKDIPEQFHRQVTPAFEKWDKEVQKAQSKYAPYKDFLDKDPQELGMALQVAELLRTNPKALYENLGERYGFANFDQDLSDEEDDSDEYDEYEDDEEESSIQNDPRFQELAEKYNQMAQYIQAQEQQKQAAEAEQQAQQEVNSAFDQIESSINRNLSEREKQEIIQRTVVIGDKTGNYDIIEGYKDFSKFVNTIRNQPRAADSAPRVLSGNGGLPVKNQDADLDQKFDQYAALIEAANKNQ